MSQSFSVSSSDPYMFSLKVMEQLSKNVKIVEKKNLYETDGPHHRSVVDFDTIELIDDFSKIVFHFSLVGEDGTLRANIDGHLHLIIDETGFFSQMFTDYYVKNIFPLLRKMSEGRINFFGENVDKIFGRAE